MANFQLSSPDRESDENKDKWEVFVSYTWGGESEQVAEKLEQAFARRGIRLIRDKKDLEYKGSIDEFERLLGKGKCVVLIISDKSLRSEHCMYELMLVGNYRDFWDRVFPIVLEDAKIYKPIDRVSYIEHWESEIDKLEHAIKSRNSVTKMSGIIADLEKYRSIRDSFDSLAALLKDMNSLTPEKHAKDDYSILIDAVAARLGKVEPPPPPPPNGDLSLKEMIEIFSRDFVTVEECDEVARSLESFLRHLSFPLSSMYLKDRYTIWIREIITKVKAFRGIRNRSVTNMENDKREISDQLTDLLRDLKDDGVSFR